MLINYKNLCEDLLIKYGLKNWKCKINHSHNEWSGICRHSSKVIELSHYLSRCSESYIIDTVLHEIAHAICGYNESHGEKWKYVCEKIGCSGEINGARIYEKYLAICSNCGYHHTRNELIFNSKLSCVFCCEKHSNGLYDSRFKLDYKTYEI